jgi:hypothetical protein
MHNLFTEASAHAGLARTVEQLGQPRFWRQLMLLLQHWVPFDNALAMFYPAPACRGRWRSSTPAARATPRPWPCT